MGLCARCNREMETKHFLSTIEREPLTPLQIKLPPFSERKSLYNGANRGLEAFDRELYIAVPQRKGGYKSNG